MQKSKPEPAAKRKANDGDGTCTAPKASATAKTFGTAWFISRLIKV
jgi:hypothetical protein